MNPSLLMDNFSLIADSPNGIKKLREMILQLAVMGKLVSQDPNDEPASVLLEKIAAEKERLIKDENLKLNGKLELIEKKDIPYELPLNWVWVHLSDVVYNFGQKKPDVDFTYLDVSSINKELGVISSDTQLLKPENAPSRARKIVRKGCVIYSTVRPYLLNIAIVDKDFCSEPIASTAFAVLNPYSSLNNRYLYSYLRSQPFINYVESEMTGMAYPAINDTKLYHGLVPLPPLEEQKRIVAKVDQLMSICDELEALQQHQNESRVHLNNAALNKLLDAGNSNKFNELWQLIYNNFDMLYDNLDNVAKLKQAILQLAVMGKLVPQDPNDEPTRVQLSKIKSDKKQTKNLLPITIEEIPFPIPETWVWTKLGLISDYNESKKVHSNDIPQDAWVLDLEDIEKNTSRILQKVLFKERDSKSTKAMFEIGDVLYGKLRPYLNKVLVADSEGYCTTEIVPIKPYTVVNSTYLMYLLKGPYFLDYVNSKTYGVKMPRLGTSDALNALVPLPPLEEQKRIVAKVDQLMALCEELEVRISKSHGDGERLSNAVLSNLIAVE